MTSSSSFVRSKACSFVVSVFAASCNGSGCVGESSCIGTGVSVSPVVVVSGVVVVVGVESVVGDDDDDCLGVQVIRSPVAFGTGVHDDEAGVDGRDDWDLS